MMNFILQGRPISVNHYKRPAVSGNGKSFMYVPTEVKNAVTAWKLIAQNAMRLNGWKMREDDSVSVEMHFFFENRARRDIDNYLKVMIDTLTGIAYKDDKQIHFLKVTKSYDGTNPRTEIIIK